MHIYEQAGPGGKDDGHVEGEKGATSWEEKTSGSLMNEKDAYPRAGNKTAGMTNSQGESNFDTHDGTTTHERLSHDYLSRLPGAIVDSKVDGPGESSQESDSVKRTKERSKHDRSTYSAGAIYNSNANGSGRSKLDTHNGAEIQIHGRSKDENPTDVAANLVNSFDGAVASGYILLPAWYHFLKNCLHPCSSSVHCSSLVETTFNKQVRPVLRFVGSSQHSRDSRCGKVGNTGSA